MGTTRSRLRLSPRGTGPDDDRVGLWRQNPIFAAAAPDACQELAARFRAQVHPATTQLAAEGSPARLLVLLRGVARAFHRMADGLDATMWLARAPMIFGDIELLHRIPFLENVAAVDDVEVATVPPEAYEEFLTQNPASARQQLLHLAAASCVLGRNQLQVFASVEQRMANLFMSYADLFGRRRGERIVIERPLSQQQIAGSTGSVRRSVALVLSGWQKAGYLRRDGAHLVLLQPERLEELAAHLRGGLVYHMGMRLDRLSRPDRLSPAELEVLSGPGSIRGTSHRVDGEILVGRRPPCQLLLPDLLVSETHCRVFRGATGRRFWVEDLGSVNGTSVNGRPVKRAVLCSEDRLRVGGITLRFRLLTGQRGRSALVGERPDLVGQANEPVTARRADP